MSIQELQATLREHAAAVSDDGLAGRAAASLRRAVAAGVPIADAVTALATTPARVLGLSSTVGALVPGHRANLLVLDADLAAVGVMVDGEWLHAPP